MNKKAIFFLIFFIFLIASAHVVESQGTTNSKGSTIKKITSGMQKTFSGIFGKGGKITKFKEKFLTKQRISNYGILFALFTIIGTILLKEQFRQNYGGGSGKIIYYIIFFVLAVIITVNVTSSNQFLWEKETIKDFKIYTLGDKASSINGCTYPQYEPKIIPSNVQKPFCRQPILRTGSQGKGLPVFLIGALLTLIVLRSQKEKLGLTDDATSNWIMYGASILLGAMMANSGHTKAYMIRFAGWIVLILWYYALQGQGKLGQEKPGWAAGFSFAIIETVLNLLGSGLFRDYLATTGTNRFVYNIGLGIAIGFVWNMVVGKNEKWESLKETVKEVDQSRLQELYNKGLKGKLAAYIMATTGLDLGAASEKAEEIFGKGKERLIDAIEDANNNIKDKVGEGDEDIDIGTEEEAKEEAEIDDAEKDVDDSVTSATEEAF